MIDDTPSAERMGKFSSGKIPSLDGWRAISVTGVLIAHWNLSFIPDAWRVVAGIGGVRFFFIISGFLITWLMLREATHQNRVNLQAFYIRRAFRILPVYLCFLGFCALLIPFSVVSPTGSQWFASIFFLANYANLPHHFGHLWTLAVEEQFYLLWPFVFAALLLYHSLVKSCWILGTAIAAAPLCRAIHYLMASSPVIPFNRFSFLLHCDSIAAGCLVAMAFWFKPSCWNLLDRYRFRLMTTAILTILATSPLVPTFKGSTFLQFVFGPSLQTMGFVTILLLSLSSMSGPLYRLLNLPILVNLGILSYSIYIWHLPFAPGHTGVLFLSNLNMNIQQFLFVPLSLFVAMISYRFLEKPFLNLRKRYLTHD